jgi:cellulose synthase/poly-beta-1,6-N-acetylglucosamine synthase-like glycosyltransferase
MMTQVFVDYFASASLVILVFAGGVYFLTMLILAIGMFRVKSGRKMDDDAALPTVTVLVTARNEEEDLPDCIRSLQKLDYPADRLQIILVNDRSDDRTPEIIRKAASEDSSILALNTTDFDFTVEGKARGIATGFSKATGEWVAITDADATVHPGWLKHMLSGAPEDVGMLGGMLVIEPTGWVGWIERMSWAFLQTFNLGASGYGVTIICVGPNMMMRRSIYEQCGGLEKANFRVAEDLALQNMVKDSGYRLKIYMDEQTSVHLKPVPGLKYILSQQRRWLGGGYGDPVYFIPLLVGFSLGALYSFVLLYTWHLSLVLWLGAVVSRFIVDGLSMYIQKRRLGESGYLRLTFLIQLVLPLLILLVTVSFLFTRKIRWMGKGYSIEYK